MTGSLFADATFINAADCNVKLSPADGTHFEIQARKGFSDVSGRALRCCQQTAHAMKVVPSAAVKPASAALFSVHY